MIETTKKILKKLADNIDKYQVRCAKFPSDSYLIDFIADKNYHMTITRSDIRWCTEIGTGIETQLDEYYQHEILDLCQKLKRECENYTSTMFRNFADESDNEPDNDLE